MGSHGLAWYEVRSLVQQDMMRPQSAMFYIPGIEQISGDMVSLLHTARGEDDTVENVVDLVFRWALESISSVFLDTRPEMTILYWPKNIYPIFPKKDPQKFVH